MTNQNTQHMYELFSNLDKITLALLSLVNTFPRRSIVCFFLHFSSYTWLNFDGDYTNIAYEGREREWAATSVSGAINFICQYLPMNIYISIYKWLIRITHVHTHERLQLFINIPRRLRRKKKPVDTHFFSSSVFLFPA